ncbi:hypothetical protein ACWD1Z_34960 [Streptomyces sp. NPDC002784]
MKIPLVQNRALWNERLDRAPDTAPPALRTRDDLIPRSCTVDEAVRASAPARTLQGTAPTRGGLAITAPDGLG